MSERLKEALRAIGAARRIPAPPAERPTTPAAFRASMDERLERLEAQVGELHRLMYGLLFVLVGEVAASVIVGVGA